MLRYQASRLGLEITNADCDEAIQAMPELQENGRFNRELLERVLQINRDRGEFEGQVRQDLLNRRLRGLVVDGVSVSDAEIEDRYRQEREQLNLEFVKVPSASLEKSVTLSDEELAKWVADHPDRYRLPPRVRVRYVAYQPKDFAALAAPSDAAVQAYYDAHRADRFTAPEEIRARHILIKLAPDADEKQRAEARKKAEDALDKLKKGADFAKLAQQVSEDPGSASKGGDLGLFSRGKMVPAFDAAAFALEPGALSEIVESPFGLHIIKVEEKLPGGPKPLEVVRQEIVQTLTDEQGLDLARKQAESDRRDVVRGKRLAEVAGGRLKETPPFAATDEVPGVGRLKAFTDAAFALGPDQPSDLIEGDDVIYLLEPIEHLDPHVPSVAELGDRPVEDARRARSDALAKERGEKLLARAKEIGLDKAAAEQQLPVDTTGPFERRANVVPKLAGAPELRTDALALTTEQPLGPKVYTVGGDAVVVALKDRVRPDPAGLADAKDSIKSSLLQQKQQEAMQAFMDHLKQRAQQDGALAVHADAVAEG